MTGLGEQFIKSLQDGRAVWLDGERVDKIAGHPAFQGTLNTLKRLFDTLDDPKLQGRVGFRSPKTGDYVHNAYLALSSAEDLKRRTRAFEIWGRMDARGDEPAFGVRPFVGHRLVRGPEKVSGI
ncbi:4-hydroxyphenylacetate 3-hydroxylase N-terminal domain-containing protein [Thermoactinomyces sp. CICC 24226]|jgi:4-hydroxyphenylacetate 3-monooxygenase|uniref:4-hydroxyphenylacetate 3-hydroxylase N-terminal domain-containing protein n=1 Tax=Thermoactinomyces sp. CICC 24226 TaxID=2767431 RepID=UPI000B3040FF|nr:4-hydroxyphenylacetate 3-hydroxylase N-terminal domain-containing protein [Thermoactinomyces sp. CICC 24226]